MKNAAVMFALVVGACAAGCGPAQVEALSIHAASRTLGEEIGVHLLVYDLDDLRGALKPDARGRVPRGNLAALRRLMEKESG